MSAVGGVEKNTESRFVDYTIATPYEEFVADIEKLIKDWHRVCLSGGRINKNVMYESTEFNVATFNKQMNRGVATIFSEWFGVTDFMLLSTVNKVSWTSDAGMLKKVAYSALITALDSTKTKYPGFVVVCPQSRLSSRSKDDILGYCIAPSNCPSNMTVKPKETICTTQFESSVSPAEINSKHELFYIDGLRSLYDQKIQLFSLLDENSISSTKSEDTVTNVVIKEQYRCVLPSRIPLVSSVAMSNTDGTNIDDGLPVNDTQSANVSISEEFAVFGDEMEDYENVLYHDVTSNHAPESQDYLLDHSSDFPRSTKLQWLRDRRGRCSDSHNLIHEVIVNLQYGSEAYPSSPSAGSCGTTTETGELMLPSGRLVDNEYYTTLFPSQQPVSAWSIDIVLAENVMAVSASGKALAATQILPTVDRKSMAGCLRRLLALYICGKCCMNMTVPLISAIEPAVNAASARISNVTDERVPSSPAQLLGRYLDVEKCHVLAVVLSTESQQAMMKFCSLEMDSNSSNVNTANARHILRRRKSSMSPSSKQNSPRMSTDPSDASSDVTSTTTSPSSSPKGRFPPNITLAEKLFDTCSADMSWQSTPSPIPSERTLPHLFNLPPLHHLVSLLSIYIGHSSHDTLADVGVFWSSWCAQLRLHWEEGVPLPHMLPSVASIGNIFLSCPASFYSDANCHYKETGGDTSVGSSVRQEFESLGKALPTSWLCNNTLLNMHHSGGNDGYGIPCFPKEPRGLPIPTQTLICQKLQMIDLCILFKDDDMIWQPSVSSTLKGKAPYKMEEEENTDDDDDEFFDAEDTIPGPHTLVSQPSHNTTPRSSDAIKRNDASTIQCPPLLRRLPMTSDGWKSQVKLLSKMGAADEARKSLATEELDEVHTSLSYKTLLVEWQLRMPHVVSDIKSFKAVNKSASIDDFIAWYIPYEPRGGTMDKGNESEIRFDESVCLLEKSCRDIWKLLCVLADDGCGGIPAIEQKPLFRPEQEAEKAMSYLESLTPFQIASCLLPNAMVAALEMLQCRCQLAGHLEEEIIRSDLKLLKETIEVALEQLALDTPQDQYFIHATRSPSATFNEDEPNGIVRTESEDPVQQEGYVNQQVLMAIDAVCGLTDHLERLNDSLTEVTALLPSAASGNVHSLSTSPVRQLIVSLCRSHHAQAKTLEESKELFTLAKQISRKDAAGRPVFLQQQQQVNHRWHSTDGRELGVPWKKSIQFATTFVSPVPKMGSLLSNKFNSSLECGESDLHDDSGQVQQSMCAVLVDNTLRVNFKLCEVEF